MWDVIHGDCLQVMESMGDNTVSAIITDPPYGLSFMGKDWDHGVPGVRFWVQALRVAKPGSMLMAFGGTRTSHRLTCAIEDAGWMIRDRVSWLYGTGFPKSLDISKSLDKLRGVERPLGPKKVSADGTVFHDSPGKRHSGYERPWHSDPDHVDRMSRVSYPVSDPAQKWDGWGTALKPGWEPIVLAMKPMRGTFAQNALDWGVAGLWIDGNRIGAGHGVARHDESSSDRTYQGSGSTDFGVKPGPRGGSSKGRWPPNVIMDESVALMLDQQSGYLKGGGSLKGTEPSVPGKHTYGKWNYRGAFIAHGDDGGASRFFYVAKPSKRERGDLNTHPTVKPIGIMRYLCRLVMMPDGATVLDPFCGSGSTGVAAVGEGLDFIGIDVSEEYCSISRERLRSVVPTGRGPSRNVDVSRVTGEWCPICRRPIVLSGGDRAKVYCSDGCRQKAYRSRLSRRRKVVLQDGG